MDDNKMRITRKSKIKGEDGTKVISVRIKEDLLEKIDNIAGQAERSRNELINIILEKSIDNIVID